MPPSIRFTAALRCGVALAETPRCFSAISPATKPPASPCARRASARARTSWGTKSISDLPGTSNPFLSVELHLGEKEEHDRTSTANYGRLRGNFSPSQTHADSPGHPWAGIGISPVLHLAEGIYVANSRSRGAPRRSRQLCDRYQHGGPKAAANFAAGADFEPLQARRDHQQIRPVIKGTHSARFDGSIGGSPA